MLSTPGQAHFATFRVLVYRQLLPSLVQARPFLDDDEMRTIVIAAVRTGPVRFDSDAWIGFDSQSGFGLDAASAKRIAWLSDAGSSAARLHLVRGLSSSWLLTEPAPRIGPAPLRPLQLVALQSVIKVLLLHLNGRSAERLVAVDTASRLVQWAQSAVLSTISPPPPRPRAGSGARMSRQELNQTLRTAVLHGPTDLSMCKSAAAV